MADSRSQPPAFMLLFTRERGIGILGSSYPRSCIPHPDTPRIAPPDAPHSPAPLELVTPMDRYARLRMGPFRKQMYADAIISEGRSNPSHTLLRGSEWGKAKGWSQVD